MKLTQAAIEELKAIKASYVLHVSNVEYIAKNKEHESELDSLMDINKHMLWAMSSYGQMSMWVMAHYDELIEVLDASIDVSPEEHTV